MQQEQAAIRAMIERIRQVVTSEEKNLEDFIEASTLAQTVLHHTSGEGHPAMSVLKEGMDKRYWPTMLGGCRTVLMLFDNDALDSPRLRVARELEGDVLEEQLAAGVEVDSRGCRDRHGNP